MPFSVSYGLSLMCLTMLLAQVRPQCHRPQARSPGQITPPCCVTASNATIREAVNACFEQKETTFSHCKIHAYVLTNENKAWCVDPTAWWLQQRLQRLEKRGICCQIL